MIWNVFLLIIILAHRICFFISKVASCLLLELSMENPYTLLSSWASLSYPPWILPFLLFVNPLDFAVHLSDLSSATNFFNHVIYGLLIHSYRRKLVSCSYFLSSCLDSSSSSLRRTGNLSSDDWFSCRKNNSGLSRVDITRYFYSFIFRFIQN